MKKLLAVVLSIAMAISVTGITVLGAESEAVYDGNPVIVVRGIDFAGLINEDETKAFSFDIGELLKALLKLGAGALSKQEDFLVPTVVEYCHTLFDPIASNKDGTSAKEGVTMKKYLESAAKTDLSEFGEIGETGLFLSAAEKIGGENVYFFTYDWRKAPKTIAAELEQMISLVKSETGKEQVHLAPCSMGGMVATAYLYYYGHENVESVTYLSSAHNGTYVVGDALSGNIVINPTALSNYLNCLTRDQNILVKALVKVLEVSGIYEPICSLLNDFIAENKGYVYDELLRDCFGTAMGLWALCPDEDFDKCKEYIFAEADESYDVTLENLAEVREFVFATEDTIAEAFSKGTKISFVSNYGLGLVPVYEDSLMQGDMTLEVELTSDYATVALLGETLSSEYLDGIDAEYISPDKSLDASTCNYKNSTWFVKNANHVACNYGSQYADFALWLITSEKQPTVYDNPLYPRFLQTDSAQNFVR